MAKKKFGNVADGLFTTSPSEKRNPDTAKPATPEPAPAYETKPVLEKKTAEALMEEKKEAAPVRNRAAKKTGRPRGKDLQEDEQTKPVYVYLTDETAYMVDLYALKKKMDRSEVIRRLIRKYCKEDA